MQRALPLEDLKVNGKLLKTRGNGGHGLRCLRVAGLEQVYGCQLQLALVKKSTVIENVLLIMSTFLSPESHFYFVSLYFAALL